MARPAPESPTAPFAVRFALIAFLPLLALAVFLDGRQYDPDIVELRPRQSASTPDPALLPSTVAGLQRAGQVRRFGKDNLYEYINGHAEYFIGAGFRGLIVGEYGASGDGEPALVVNLYDMGEPLNAFGVLVDEAGDQEAVDIGGMGFLSGQGLSFIQGPYYVQLSLFQANPPPEIAGTELARNLADQVEGPDLAFRFPDLGRVVSTRYVKEDYRGLEFLKEVLERGFERDGHEIQSFLVQRPKAKIDELVAAFEAFFLDDDIRYQRIEREGLNFFQIDDPYEGEWFFVPLSEYLVGVYAPLDEGLTAAIKAFAKSSH